MGNIQLTDIKKDCAILHIFIGNKNFWGQKIASNALSLLLNYAKKELKLKELYLEVNPENKAAIKLYQNADFNFIPYKSLKNFNIMRLDLQS